MTQERVNNNNSYAFVLEDPSKPRKYQLNFNLDTEYVKEPAQMDQLIPHHQYNPLHNQPQPPPQQRQASTQITLPSIRDLIPIPPPVPQPIPSTHRHPYHHQSYSHPKQHQESLMTSSARPHLPPLQPSTMESPSNPSAFNYAQPFFPNPNNAIQNDKSDRVINDRDQSNLHPSSIQQQQQQQQRVLLSTSDAYNSHQNYSSPHFAANQQHQQPLPPQRQHNPYQPNNNNNNNNNNTAVSQQSSPPSHHVSQQQLQHQSYQQIPQQHNQHTHVTQHHHNHLHNNHHHQQQHQQQQQNLPQTHHHQQKHHHHQVITNNSSSSSSSSTVSQNFQSNVYNSDIVIPERSQHDLQSASTVPPPYNAHNRQSYYSQVYPGSSPPHSHNPMSLQQQQQQQQSQPPPPHQMTSQPNISAPPSDILPYRNSSSADHSTAHPQQNIDRRFIQRESINSHHVVHEQQQNSHSPQPQSQSFKMKVQQPPLSDLLNPSRSISRPITPPQSLAPSQQTLIARDNRETSPYLVPPPQHQSGSNSSASTRSSSPAPITPVTNTNAISNSNHNLPYSPHHSPNNNMVTAHIDKPTTEQTSTPPKKRGRSQKPRPIVPAGPLPNQQPAISSQVQPQSSATNDSPVFVQYVVPTNGGNNTVDASSQSLPASKSSHATRPRKNSSVGGGGVPSAPKRTRKQKDNVPVHVTQITEGENKNNNQVLDSHQLPPVVVNNPPEGSSSLPTISTNQGTSTIPSRKREHSMPSSPRDISEIKRCKKEENMDSDVDVVMEDVSTMRDDYAKSSLDGTRSSPSSKNHMEAVMILQSLKKSENSSTQSEVVASPLATSDIVDVKKGEIPKQISEDPKIDQVDHLVATKVRELSLDEGDQFKEEGNMIKSPSILSSDLAKHSRSGESVNHTLTNNNKPNKKGFGVGNNSRNDVTHRVSRVKQAPPFAINNHNVGNDSDNDLAMDDGSDEEECTTKRNQPMSNNSVDDQWNSDEMETEEEVEEEVATFENTEVKDENKPTFVSSPSPLPSLPPPTTSHPNLARTKNDDSKDSPSTTSAVTCGVTTTMKHSHPASPITASYGTASSLVSRKGSVSSNGSNKDKDILSDVLEMPLASPLPSAATSNHSTNGSGRPQRPCPPRRRSTMRDDEKLELDAIEWEKNIEIPHHIWEETLRVFEIVKHSKEMKNRQPHRKRNHILASILFILCRQNGLPRTFVEICNAASIRKQEIGSYYRLMLKVFESNGLGGGSNGTVDSAEYLKRWCQNLKLPPHILEAAIHVYKQASELNITTGKCPVSVGAASIWLSISSWNEIRSSWNSNDDHEQIKCEHKDVAQAAGVVNATLVGCFKNLSKYKDQLLPAEFLREAKTRSPYHHKKNDLSEGNTSNNVVENDCRDEKKTSFFSPSPSLENLKFYGPLDEDDEVAGNDKAKAETIKVEPTTPSISALPIKVDPTISSGLKPSQVESASSGSRICKAERNSPKSVKVEHTLSPFKEIKTEKSSPASKATESEPQGDADDELEEGELREDCDDAMMD